MQIARKIFVMNHVQLMTLNLLFKTNVLSKTKIHPMLIENFEV